MEGELKEDSLPVYICSWLAICTQPASSILKLAWGYLFIASLGLDSTSHGMLNVDFQIMDVEWSIQCIATNLGDHPTEWDWNTCVDPFSVSTF